MDNMQEKDNKVYIISLIVVIVFALWGIIGPASFEKIADGHLAF